MESETNFNSPENGSSRKRMLSHRSDSPDTFEEYNIYGSAAKQIQEINSLRKERLKVVSKFEGISAAQSIGEQSERVLDSNAKNALKAISTVQEGEDVQMQCGMRGTSVVDFNANTALIVTSAAEEDGEVHTQGGKRSTSALDSNVNNALVTTSAIEDDEPVLDLNDLVWDFDSPDGGDQKPVVDLDKLVWDWESDSSDVKIIEPPSGSKSQGDDLKPVLDLNDLVWHSDSSDVEIINAPPDHVPKKPRSKRSKSKVKRKRVMHIKMDNTKPQVPDDCQGSEELYEVFRSPIPKGDANGNQHEIADECNENNQTAETPSLDDDTASDSEARQETDELGDMWTEMGLAIEYSKGNADIDNSAENNTKNQTNEDCEHSLILKDDIGYVCRICGLIQKDIQSIHEYQYMTHRSSRTYSKQDSRSKGIKDPLEVPAFDIELSENGALTTFSAHPRHAKLMRPHQVEGFRFLAQNLVSDKPSGCILAHAPGSGKTFMIISFIQSFMAKYPEAKPLIVLPKGILPVWKREFLKWQIEDMSLYDLYSSKPDKSQRLELLTKWVKNRGILFMGYAQFSSIMGGCGNNEIDASCQKILSEAPSVLILDEGHTPRNSETEIVNSISKVRTPRKVVLSGTLYQNHVREVFNILNLVHPKFLQSHTPREIANRIMSRVEMGGRRNIKFSDGFFQDLVEQALQSDDQNIKLHVIKDLREMTKDILHYYKGDVLDNLFELDDFTVVLNLTARQKALSKKLKRVRILFKRNSEGSAIYLHPDLKPLTKNTQFNKEKQTACDDATVDRLIEHIDINDGVKAKFFLNVLRLCQITGEKLLVFSQYLLPLKFLERLTMEEMKWSPGLEIFMITGDSNTEMRERYMNQFNDTPAAKVFFGSIKACGEGISLVGASRIIILDVHPNPSVTRQAVGRAFRPGQQRKVVVYRLIAAETMEEEDHGTYFRKELVSKLWFEWNQYSNPREFDLKQVVVNDCGDNILESPNVHSDVKTLYRR